MEFSRDMTDLGAAGSCRQASRGQDRTATRTAEDLAGAPLRLSADECRLPQRREQLRQPVLFLLGESVAGQSTPTTTTTPSVDAKLLPWHSTRTCRHFYNGMQVQREAGSTLGLPALHLHATDRDACIDRVGAGSNAEAPPTTSGVEVE